MPVRRILVYVVCRSAGTGGAGTAGRRSRECAHSPQRALTPPRRCPRRRPTGRGICPALRWPARRTPWWLKRVPGGSGICLRARSRNRILGRGPVPPSTLLKQLVPSRLRGLSSDRVPRAEPRGLPESGGAVRRHNTLRRAPKPSEPKIRILEEDAGTGMRRRRDSVRAPSGAGHRQRRATRPDVGGRLPTTVRPARTRDAPPGRTAALTRITHLVRHSRTRRPLLLRAATDRVPCCSGDVRSRF